MLPDIFFLFQIAVVFFTEACYQVNKQNILFSILNVVIYFSVWMIIFISMSTYNY